MTLVEIAPSDDLRLILSSQSDRRAPFDAAINHHQGYRDRALTLPVASLPRPGSETRPAGTFRSPLAQRRRWKTLRSSAIGTLPRRRFTASRREWIR